MAWRDTTEQPNCSDTELLTIAGPHQHSKLFVLCGDRFESSKVLQAGEFSARFIRVGGRRSVAMATCTVGDHRWMLAKDSMAVRVGERAFVFAFPGVLYGLCLPWESSVNVIRQLEEIFVSGMLFVLCGDRFESSKVLQAGEFSARFIRVGGRRSVAMATCTVGDHRWMLAKDSMAVRVGERAFVFAFPGVLYGLCLPWESSVNVIRQLEEIFVSYCAYQDLVARNGADTWRQSESEMWTLAYEKLKNLAAQSSTKIAAAAVKAPTASGGGGCPIYDIAATKIQRAVRMSAAAKLASRALLSGALVPHQHLHVAFPPVPAAALPSVWALAGLLDAIESGGRATTAAAPLWGRKGGFWWLRMEGMELLLEAARAFDVTARKKKKYV